MDSCHIFNFLFGTRKATTELSKCFSSTINEQSKKTSQNGACSANQPSQQPPASPLKQLQMKLAGLTTSSKTTRSNTQRNKQQQQACDAAGCGTFRATLVDEVIVKDEDNEEDGDIKQESHHHDPSTKDRLNEVSNNNPVFDNKNEPDEDENLAEQQTTKSIELEHSLDHNGNIIVGANGEEQVHDDNRQAPTNGRSKRIVLYAEPANYDKQVVASAEVYEIETEFGQARAKLRRVSSISIDRNDESIESNDKSNADVSVGDQNDGSKTNYREKFHKICEDKKNDEKRVKNLVQSFESTSLKGGYGSTNLEDETTPIRSKRPSFDRSQKQGSPYRGTPLPNSKPTTIVKPLPPKTPPKSNKTKYLKVQLSLNKPTRIEQLFEDETFLVRFFDKLEPLDRCNAAQVCRQWRNILYSKQSYWKDLISVIDCTQLRREHLTECIMNTLQSAKLRQQTKHLQANNAKDSPMACYFLQSRSHRLRENRHSAGSADLWASDQSDYSSMCADIDQDEIWRIQELCNKFTRGNMTQNSSYMTPNRTANGIEITGNHQDNQITNCLASKSSSIPSQISSTLSSVSISSLLSPLSESSRIDSIKEKLYSSLNSRGFDAICLFGASDDDIEDLVSKIPSAAHERILVGRLNNCSISDRGLELFMTTFNQIEELELSGCNEITNSIEFQALTNLQRLILTDCINIGDGIAQRLVDVFHKLKELTIQAYHLTDSFLEYLSYNSKTNNLKRLELPNCKEITFQSLNVIAKHFKGLQTLSISGSTKISDDGIELLADECRQLQGLDLSWCTKISDASLECIACDLGSNLTELILDRNVQVTDNGIGYLATMSKLTLLYIRWCPRITDLGLETLFTIKSLRYLSLAGLHQITARSLLCLVETELLEVELTNCPAVTGELLRFLSDKMPKCNIIF